MRRPVASLASLAALVATAPAAATAPGENGPVTYISQQRYVDLSSSGEPQEGSHSDVFAVPPGGGTPVNVTMTCEPDLTVDWSTTGRLAFTTFPAGGFDPLAPPSPGAVLQTAAADGRDIRTIVAGAEDAAWSPDATRIAFTAPERDLFVVGADGSGRALVAGGPDFEIAPEWSPDGTRIAFLRTFEGAYALWTVRPDGTDARELYTFARQASTLDWSPDGRHIAVGGGGRVDLAAVDGSGMTGVLVPGRDEDRTYGFPSFAPDGTQMAFATGALNDAAARGVWTVELSTGIRRQLVQADRVMGVDWAPATAQIGPGPSRTDCPFPGSAGAPDDPDDPPTAGGGSPRPAMSARVPQRLSVRRIVAGDAHLRVVVRRAMTLRITIQVPDAASAKRLALPAGVTTIGRSTRVVTHRGAARVPIRIRRALRPRLRRLVGAAIGLTVTGTVERRRVGTVHATVALVP